MPSTTLSLRAWASAPSGSASSAASATMAWRRVRAVIIDRSLSRLAGKHHLFGKVAGGAVPFGERTQRRHLLHAHRLPPAAARRVRATRRGSAFFGDFNGRSPGLALHGNARRQAPV